MYPFFPVSRTSLYFGCIGFVVGGIVGVAVGLSWKKNQPNVQRMKAVVCTSYKGFDVSLHVTYSELAEFFYSAVFYYINTVSFFKGFDDD
jgi:hypothetical protein